MISIYNYNHYRFSNCTLTLILQIIYAHGQDIVILMIFIQSTKLHSFRLLIFVSHFTMQLKIEILLCGSEVGHIHIGLWVNGSSGSSGVTHFQCCCLVILLQKLSLCCQNHPYRTEINVKTTSKYLSMHGYRILQSL